jgi:hypothetical protein
VIKKVFRRERWKKYVTHSEG